MLLQSVDVADVSRSTIYAGATRTTWPLPGLSCSLLRSRRAPRLMLSTCGEAGQSRGYRVDTDAYVCGSSYAVVIVIHVQQLFGPLLSIDASCPSSEAGPPWTRTCENHGRDRESLEALLVNTRTVGAGCPFPHFASPHLSLFLPRLLLSPSVERSVSLHYCSSSLPTTVTTACA